MLHHDPIAQYGSYLNSPIKYLSSLQLKTYGLSCAINDPVVLFTVVNQQNQFQFYKYVPLKYCIHLDTNSILLTCQRTGRQLKMAQELSNQVYDVIIKCIINPILKLTTFKEQLDDAKKHFYDEPSHLNDVQELINQHVLKKTGFSAAMMWSDHTDSEYHYTDTYQHGVNGCDSDQTLMQRMMPQHMTMWLKHREQNGL